MTKSICDAFLKVARRRVEHSLCWSKIWSDLKLHTSRNTSEHWWTRLNTGEHEWTRVNTNKTGANTSETGVNTNGTRALSCCTIERKWTRMKHGNSQNTPQDNVSNYQNMLALSTRFNIRALYKETKHCRKFNFGMFLIIFLAKAVLCSIQLSCSPWIKHANCLFYRVYKK